MAGNENAPARALVKSLTPVGGAVFLLSEVENTERKVLSTGVEPLNAALGIGGVPVGRIIEMFGSEGTGKSTLALMMAAQAQRAAPVLYLDAEHTLDQAYAVALGLDPALLVVAHPDSAEHCWDMMHVAAKAGQTSLIVLDSLAAIVPASELDGTMGDSSVAESARINSRGIRNIVEPAASSDTTVLITNQTRQAIGRYSGMTTTGGNALKFYASVRISLSYDEVLKDGDTQVGLRVRATVKKNKCAPQGTTAVFDLIYGRGVSRGASLLDLALAKGVVSRAGAWFSLGKTRIGQGRLRVATLLDQNEHLFTEVRSAVENAAG